VIRQCVGAPPCSSRALTGSNLGIVLLGLAEPVALMFDRRHDSHAANPAFLQQRNPFAMDSLLESAT
jgi:hypothetical protein